MISALIMSGFVTVPSVHAVTGNTFRITGPADSWNVGVTESIELKVELSGQIYDEDYNYRLVFLDYSKSQTNPEAIIPDANGCDLWWESGCEFYLTPSENITTGGHHIGAVIEKSNSNLSFDKEIEDVHSLTDVGEIVQETKPLDRYYFNKLDSYPVLSQETQYFTSDYMSDSREKDPQILIQWNSFSYEDKYTDYVYDITHDEIVGDEYPIDELKTLIYIDKTNDDYLQYQIIRAKTRDIDDIYKQSKSVLEDIQYESNIVEFERRLWSIDDVYPAVDLMDRPQLQHTIGGGDRSIYLEDNTTGKIIWADQEDTEWNELWDWWNEPNYGHTPIDNIDWVTYWIADPWEGDFADRPRHVDDLQNKIVNSRGLKDSIPDSNRGIQTPEQVAGGVNKIEPCINQSCKADPVNLFTGEFFETTTDLRGVGGSMIPDSTRSFSTIRKDKLGVMGYGWRNSYEMGLESDGSSLVVDNEIRFVQENGATSYFYKQGDGSYKTPSSVELKVLANGKFELSNKLDHTIIIFSSTGKFEKITDLNNNSLTMTYANNKVSKALSSNGSYIDFTYNTAGLLTKATTDTGDTATYTYNASKQLTSIKNQDGVIFDYTYDTKRRVKTLSNAMGGVITNTYDTENRVTRQVDPLGGIYRFVYTVDGLNATTDLTNPNGLKTRDIYQAGYLVSKIESPDTTREKKWSYSYDRNNNMTATINPNGSVTSMTYDSKNNPITVRNSLGGVSKFTYNDRKQILTVEDDAGNITQSRYDSKGNLTEIEDALGNITKYAWDLNGKLVSVIDARGVSSPAVENDYKTVYSYTTKGLLESTTNPENGVLSYAYDGKGRATGMTTPQGNSTPLAGDYTNQIVYGANNLPAKNIDAENNETSYTYDIAGNILTSTDALGNVTSFTYDLLGQVLTMTNSDGTTNYEYNKNGEVVKVIDTQGNITVNTYNTSGDLTKTTDPKGNVTTYTYDVVGNVLTAKDPMGKITKFSYDQAGNLLSTIDPLGNITGNTYSKQGQIVSSFDAKYNFTSYSYDELGRNTEVTLPNGSKTTVSYDAVGNMLSRINGEGDSESWVYDPMNRVTSYTDQEGDTKTYTYDKDSQPTQTTREDQSTIATQYSEIGQVKTIDYPGTDRDLSYTYDPLGRVVTEKLGASVPKLTTYDHAGRILSKNGISYEYDALGNQTKITYPTGRTANYGYDANSNMVTANISGIGTTTYTHDKNDNITTTTLPNGVTETNTRDGLGQVTDMTMKNPTQELHKYTKSYDSLGNMSNSTYGLLTQKKTETYTHDVLNRLTDVTSDIAGSTTQNDYNLANHLVKFDGKNVVTDKIGKPQTVGTQELSYDNLGNRTSITDTTNPANNKTYDWSVDNLLNDVSGSTSGISYQYDSSGLISKRTENSQTDDFLWDETATNALLLTDGDYEYVYGANRVPLAQVDLADNSIDYLHTDINGSVIAVTNDTGHLGGITNYGAYGKRQGSAISRYGYAGEWTDPTTTYTYLRARWYDPSTGSFLSKDPLYELTQESYGYANGNPLLSIDPSGLLASDLNAWQGFWASEHLSFMDSQGFKNTSDGISGFADEITLGGVGLVQEAMGTSDMVDKCSTAYKVGGYTGVAGSFVTPAGIAKQGGTTIGKSFVNVFKNSPNGRVIVGKNGEKYSIGKYGGRYGDMKLKLNGHLYKNLAEVNHIPSHAWNLKQSKPLSRADGGAILMDKSDHRMLRTTGKKNSQLSTQEANLSFKDVYNRDIKDVRNNFGSKYNRAIKDMEEYYKGIGKL